ncbi:MAG: peptidoglycan-binding protein [Proteobacteria bacterium]|nr:peptidoglycan-binding protein [Pseudomonadota bacterium]
MAPSRCIRRLSAVLAVVVALVFGLGAAPALAKDETLQEAQNTLLMLGYKPGKSDGNARPQTTQALTEFQRANKLPATGKPDDATMAALRNIRDTKFSGSFATPKSADAAPRKIQVEPKPQAQPVDPVAAAPVEAAPGTRVLSGSTTLSSAASIPPALFGGGAPGTTTAPPAAAPAALTSPAQPERQPFLGIASWNWVLPFLGIPLFGFLWWYGMRRQAGAPETETAELMQVRREPNLEKAAAPAAGRREPTL